MMNRQQADALRRENEARNSAQYQKTQASFAASNRASQAAHQAREAAASNAAHNARMAEYARGGEALRRSLSESGSRASSRDNSAYSGGGSTGKSKGGGLFVVALIVVGIIAFGGHSHTDSPGSAPASQTAPDTPTPASQVAPRTVQQAAPQVSAPDATTAAPQEPVTSAPAVPPAQSFEGSNSAASPAPDENSPVTKPLTSVPAEYPDAARQQNITGMVRVRVLIADDGSVHTAELEDGNPALADAALTAARQWTFNPTAPSDHYRISHLDFNFDGK